MLAWQFVQPDPSVLPRRMREIQRQALRSQQVLDSEGDVHEEPHIQVEVVDNDQREEQAMDEVMTNYFLDEDLTFEDDHLQPRHGHPREKLWEEAQQYA